VFFSLYRKDSDTWTKLNVVAF